MGSWGSLGITDSGGLQAGTKGDMLYNDSNNRLQRTRRHNGLSRFLASTAAPPLSFPVRG